MVENGVVVGSMICIYYVYIFDIFFESWFEQLREISIVPLRFRKEPACLQALTSDQSEELQ